MITHETSPELYTIAEAAQALRISKPTIWRWIRAGRLHPVRLGPRIVRLRRTDVAAIERAAHAVRDPQAPQHLAADPWPDVIRTLKRHQANMRAAPGSKPFDSSVPLIHEARDERDASRSGQ